MNGIGTGPPDDRRWAAARDILLGRSQRLDHRQLFVQQHRRIGDIEVQLRLLDAFPAGETLQHFSQIALHALHGLAGHGADIEIETALVRIARQPPRRAAANGRDRHVRPLTHEDMRRLVVFRPLGDVGLQLVHDRDGVGHVRPVGVRRMRHRAADRDAQPDAAHVGDRDAKPGRLGEQREIGGHAMRHQMPRADAVAGIFDALEFLDGGLLDLAHDAAKGDVAREFDAGPGNCLDRDQRGGKPALHVVGAEPPHPAVAIHGLGLKTRARIAQVLLPPGIRRIHVAGEQEVEPVAAPAPEACRVGTIGVDQRQVGIHAGPAHPLDEILRDADLLAGRACNIDEVHQQSADVFGADMDGRPGEVGMSHCLLLRLQARCADDRPPPIDLRLVIGGERLRCPADPPETDRGRYPRAACSQSDRRAHGLSRRSVLRRPPSACPWAPTSHASRQRKAPAFPTSSIEGTSGQRLPARLRHHRIGLHRTGAHRAERVGRLIEHQVELAGRHVLDCGSAAAIGHEAERRSGLLLEIDRRQPARRPQRQPCPP